MFARHRKDIGFGAVGHYVQTHFFQLVILNLGSEWGGRCRNDSSVYCILAMILIVVCTSFFHVNICFDKLSVVFYGLLATGAARSISFQDMLLYAIVRM